MGISRGIADNNPFDLRYVPRMLWAGLATPPVDDKGYCVFERHSDANPAFWGLRAGFRDLYTKWSIDKLLTIEAIVTPFAPPSENDTESYIQLVCAKTGWARDAPLDLHAPGNLKKLGLPFLIEEQGGACAYGFIDAQLDPAIAAATFSR